MPRLPTSIGAVSIKKAKRPWDRGCEASPDELCAEMTKQPPFLCMLFVAGLFVEIIPAFYKVLSRQFLKNVTVTFERLHSIGVFC